MKKTFLSFVFVALSIVSFAHGGFTPFGMGYEPLLKQPELFKPHTIQYNLFMPPATLNGVAYWSSASPTVLTAITPAQGQVVLSNGAGSAPTTEVVVTDTSLNQRYKNYTIFNVVNYGAKLDSTTNDTGAVNSAVRAAYSNWKLKRKDAVIWFPANVGKGCCYLSGYHQYASKYGGAYSLIIIPYDSNANGIFHIVFASSGTNTTPTAAGINPLFGGCKIVTDKTRVTSITNQYGMLVVPYGSAISVGTNYGFNVLNVEVTGLGFQTHWNSTQSGINCQRAEQMSVHDCVLTQDTNCAFYTAANMATNLQYGHFGIVAPSSYNGGNIYCYNNTVEGFYTGIFFNEHCNLDQNYEAYNLEGMAVPRHYHTAYIHRNLSQQNVYGVVVTKVPIIAVGETQPNTTPLMFDDFDFEHDAQVATTYDFVDSNEYAYGNFPYQAPNSIAALFYKGDNIHAYNIGAVNNGLLLSSNNTTVTTPVTLTFTNLSTLVGSSSPASASLFYNAQSLYTEFGINNANTTLGGIVGNSASWFYGTHAGMFFTSANATTGNNHFAWTLNGLASANCAMYINNLYQVGIGATADALTKTGWLNLVAGTTTIAPLVFASGTNLTTAVAGAMEYDGKNLWFTPVGTQRYTLPYTIFTATADGKDSAVSATTSIIGTGVGSTTLPANSLVAGRTIEIDVQGYIASVASPTVNIKVSIGTDTLCTTGAVSAVGTVGWFEVHCLVTCRTTGASGTVMGQDVFTEQGAGSFNGMYNYSTSVVNTTASQVVNVCATWSTHGAADVINGKVATIKVLN